MKTFSCLWQVLLFAALSVQTLTLAAQKLSSTSSVTTQRMGPCTIQQIVYSWIYADASGGTHTFPAKSQTTLRIGPGCGSSSSTTIDSWSSDGLYDLQATGSNGSIVSSIATGSILPKYVVLAVTYAPPGSRSSVSYSNTTLVGTSSGLEGTFQNNYTVSSTLGASTNNVFGLSLSGSISATSTNAFTQESDTSSSIAVNTTRSFGIQLYGPTSSSVGLSHDADIIWLWLNPVANFSINSQTPGVPNWTGYSFDERDPVGDMEVIGLQVAYLNGHAPIPANIAAVLARSWAPQLSDGSGPGLTQADFNAMLRADPFTNSSYTIPAGSQTSPDGRFVLTANQNLQYLPASMGDSPTSQFYNVGSTTVTTLGQSGQDTRQVGYSVDVNAKYGFIVDFNADLKTSNTMTWTNKWNALNTQSVGQSASLTITGPAFSDGYSGPVEFNVYQDTVYGTFMFYPVQ